MSKWARHEGGGRGCWGWSVISRTPWWCVGVSAMSKWVMPGHGVEWDFKDTSVVCRSLCHD